MSTVLALSGGKFIRKNRGMADCRRLVCRFVDDGVYSQYLSCDQSDTCRAARVGIERNRADIEAGKSPPTGIHRAHEPWTNCLGGSTSRKSVGTS